MVPPSPISLWFAPALKQVPVYIPVYVFYGERLAIFMMNQLMRYRRITLCTQMTELSFHSWILSA